MACQETIQLQDDLIEAYCDESLQNSLLALQKKFLDGTYSSIKESTSHCPPIGSGFEMNQPAAFCAIHWATSMAIYKMGEPVWQTDRYHLSAEL
eukprot:5607616-Amphidinium_carterae.1